MTPTEWRQRRRLETMETIKQTARQQIAENGAGSLSLGAVARALGMTPPALYRYFENRDALVAALVIDAYESMGKALEHADEGMAPKDYGGRFLALMRAYRRWAVAYPEDFALMYGLPTADVGMSPEQMEAFQAAVLRSMRAMVQVLHAAHRACRLDIPAPYREPPAPVEQALAWMRYALQDQSIPLGVLALAFTTWLRAEALVWQELHGHLPKALFSSGDFYEMESAILLDLMGLGRQRGQDKP